MLAQGPDERAQYDRLHGIPVGPYEQAAPAAVTVYDVLLGLQRNARMPWLDRQIREWKHMTPLQRRELVRNLQSAPWVPTATKTALKDASE